MQTPDVMPGGVVLCRCGKAATDVVPGGDPICGVCAVKLAKMIRRRSKAHRRAVKRNLTMAVPKGR